jgi:hypothetical protein
VNSCPRFAYSFTYWSWDLYSAHRQSAANKKIPSKTCYWRCEFAPLCLWAQRIFPALLISAGCHAAPITLAVAAIIASLYWRYVTRTASPILPRLAYNFWAVLTGTGKKVKTRWRPPEMKKYFPAPIFEVHTHRISPPSTDHSFRWTLPLNGFRR